MFYLSLIRIYQESKIGYRDIQLLKFKSFLDIIYEDKDYGFQNIRLFEIYLMCAKDQGNIKNKEKTLEYLYKSFYHLQEWITIYNKRKIIAHSSFLVDKLTIDAASCMYTYNPKKAYARYINSLKDEIFDFIRGNDDYKRLMSDIIKLYNQ